MQKDDVIKLLMDSPMPTDIKKAWMKRLNDEALTSDLIDELKDAVQDVMEKNFAAAGVEADPKGLDKAEKQMEKEVAAASKEFDKEMQKAEKDMMKLQENTQKNMDKLEAEMAKQDA